VNVRGEEEFNLGQVQEKSQGSVISFLPSPKNGSGSSRVTRNYRKRCNISHTSAYVTDTEISPEILSTTGDTVIQHFRDGIIRV